MKRKYFKKNGGAYKKHLTQDQKITVLKKLGYKPSKLRIQAIAKQYNVSSSTIMNWIEKGIWTQFPPEFKQQTSEQQYIDLDENQQVIVELNEQIEIIL